MKIDELFNYYGTDKAIYAAQYHALFKHIREWPRTLLEIGIGTMIPDAPENMVNYAGEGYSPGGSLRAWRDYFPNAQIHGIDIQPDTQFVDEARIHTHLCNSTSHDLVNRFIESQGGISFDIIIDDGSHRWKREHVSTLERPGGRRFGQQTAAERPRFGQQTADGAVP